MSQQGELKVFYERASGARGSRDGMLYARWRQLSAVGKAEHVIELCRRAGVEPAGTLEVGCGDGALLAELHRRGFGGRLQGLEIAQAAVEIARGRPEIDAVRLYDGASLPDDLDGCDLGILSHVLEHVPEPAMLLAEVARACAAVLVEVPLEANLSARRRSRRQGAREVGHLHSLSRADARRIVADAGLRIACELSDPLPLAVHRFFADKGTAHAAASAKWTLRAGAHRIAPALARRLFTVHYAALCLPA